MNKKTRESPMLIDFNSVRNIDEISTDSHDLFSKLVSSFIKDSDQRINLMKELIKNKKIKEIAFEAHAIKSSSMALGALKLGEMCQKLEDLPENESVDEVINLVSMMNELYDLSCKELKYILAKRNSITKENKD